MGCFKQAGALKSRRGTRSCFHSVTGDRQGLKEEPRELIARKLLGLSKMFHAWLKWSSSQRTLT